MTDKDDFALLTEYCGAGGEAAFTVLTQRYVMTQLCLRRLGTENDWKSLAVGEIHNLTIEADGSLWAWGQGIYGQLGDGMTGDSRGRPAMQKVPVPSAPGNDWRQAAVGGSHSVALKKDGCLWAWGRSAHRYTGARDQSLDVAPRQVGTTRDWKAISRSGWFYQTLLKTDGSMWALEARNLTAGSQPEPLTWTRIAVPWNPLAFGAGARRPFGVALTAGGEVWTWGKVLGEHTPDHPILRLLAQRIGWKTDRFESKPVTRDQPWLLPNVTPD